MDEEGARRRSAAVGAWLAVAAVDLAAADALMSADPDRIDPWVAAFHAQQAAEKAAKALLISLGRDFPMTHDLDVLLDRLPAETASMFDDDVASLTAFAVVQRYPAPSWDPMALHATVDPAEAATAVDMARRFLDQVVVLLMPARGRGDDAPQGEGGPLGSHRDADGTGPADA